MNRRFGPILLVMGILVRYVCLGANRRWRLGYERPRPSPARQPAYTYPDSTPSMDFLSGSLENSSITLGVGAGFTLRQQRLPNRHSSHRTVGSFKSHPTSRSSSSVRSLRGTLAMEGVFRLIPTPETSENTRQY